MKRLPLLAVLGILGVAATASAQSRRAVSRVHDFHTLDRYTPMTTFAFSFGFEDWADPTTTILTQSFHTEPISLQLPLEIHFHYVTESGIGAYVTLPMTVVGTRDIATGPIQVNGKTQFALGNIDLGGMYALRLGGRADLVAHVGVALPTATDNKDIAEAFGALGSLPRYGDLALRFPDTMFLRLGVSPMGRFGPAFWQFDLGLDAKVEADTDDAVDVSPIIHIGAGGGVDLGTADVTGELNTVITNFSTNNGAKPDNVNSTLALGARYKSQNVQPGVALVIPMSFNDAKDFNLAVLVDLSARMP